MPSSSREDTIIATAKDLTSALLSKSHFNILPPISTKYRKHLQRHVSIFDPKPVAPPTPEPMVSPTTVPEPRVSPTAAPRVSPATTKNKGAFTDHY